MQEFISIIDLARILGVTRQAVLKRLQGRINAGKIEAKTEGKKYLLKFSTLPDEVKKEIGESQIEASEKAQEIGTKPENDLGYEKQLWAAADRLRGNVDPSEYKHVVLGLIFLKYISDSFYQFHEKLQKEMNEKGNEYYVPNKEAQEKMLNDKDLYKSKGIFFIPENARWDFLKSKAAFPEIAKYIDDAMQAIEDTNPEQLTGVLPKNYVRVPLEPHILGELVNIFSKIDFGGEDKKEKDMLGRVYEYFLGQFADAEGKRGGEFYTPRPIVKLLVEILEPFENSRVMDPCVGSGGMFIQSSKFLQEHHKEPTKIAIYGQESNQTTLRLCKMNLAIRGVYGQIEYGNSHYNDKFPDLKADFVLANPPFNAEWEPDRIPESDPRLVYGIAPKGNANFMWIQHFISHLTTNGMAGFVMANGALAVSGKEGEIRKKIIENDLVDVIIACPPKLFYNVSLPVSLWFLTKNKETGRFRNRKGETLFIDARETFTQISRKQVTFTDGQIQKIAGTVRAWRGEEGEYKDIAGFCKATNIEEIAKNGFVLTPGRYVGVPEEEDDGVPFAEKKQKLETDLKQYFQESGKLEKEILENLRRMKI